MKTGSLFVFVTALTAISGISMLLFYKYRITHKFRAQINRNLRYAWLFWYSSDEVLGTSSLPKRQIMERINIVTTIIWIFLILTLIVIGLPFFIEE